MKTITPFLLLFFFIGPVFGQYGKYIEKNDTLEEFNQEAVNQVFKESPIIFEGERTVNYKNFYNEGAKTAYIYKVKSVLKGGNILKEGTVELIYHGTNGCDWLNGEVVCVPGSHWEPAPKKGIFFVDQTGIIPDSGEVRLIVTEEGFVKRPVNYPNPSNQKRVQYIKSIRGYNKLVFNRSSHIRFDSKKEVFKFLRKFGDLSFPEKEKPEEKPEERNSIKKKKQKKEKEDDSGSSGKTNDFSYSKQKKAHESAEGFSKKGWIKLSGIIHL